MAEQIVSHVLSKLGDLLIEEYLFLGGVKWRIELVKIHMGLMKSFLRDAEEKKIKNDNGTRQWVRDVRDVAFEIENAIDTYVVQIHNVTANHDHILKRFVVKITSLRELGNKIYAIQEKIHTISESRSNLGIENLGEGVVEEKPLFQNIVVPDIDNEEIVGFEVDRKQIIDALVDSINIQRGVVSIVGVGGLGKTTFAQKVYNDPRVKELFDIRIWLSISQDFKLIDVLRKLYEKATDNSPMPVEEAEAYLGEINKSLSNKRYLIVLDDIWTEDVFDNFNVGFPDVKNGSRVIITTRSLNVAIDRTGVFKLPFLNKEESLELLLKNALQTPNPLTNCPNELRDVADKLADKCHGLPLAIVVLGRLLSKKPCEPAHWSQVGKHLDWYGDGQKCINILASSYHDLPYYLQSCFRYVACFPEDHAFEAESFLRMWTAEGFMDHMDHKGTLEEKADRCLEELAQRSLVQVVDRDYHGSIYSFRVHDLLRDLAIHEAKENDFLLIYNKEKLRTDLNRARRVVIHNHHEVMSQNQNLENIAMPNVRSFLNFDRKVRIGIRYPLLRVLEFKRSKNLTKLPEELKSMIHLRYLGLKCTGLEELPETIGCLQNLQTINIAGTGVEKIPSSLWGIQALRHVTLREWLPGPPPSANLVNLQTLEYIIVPKSWRDGLPHLPSLSSLSLSYSDKEENRIIVMPDWNIIITLLGTLNNLVSLFIQGNRIPTEIADVKISPSYKHLQTLILYGADFIAPLCSTRFFLDTVELPRNLIILNLGYIWFDKDPMPKLEKLPYLKSLDLYRIENMEDMICSAGGFPKLQDLGIWFVHDLKQWKVEKEAMSLLKTLRIEGCNKLSALPDLNHVKTLQELRLIGMSDVSESKVKDRTGEEWQKIQHIPTIKYSYF